MEYLEQLDWMEQDSGIRRFRSLEGLQVVYHPADFVDVFQDVFVLLIPRAWMIGRDQFIRPDGYSIRDIRR